MYRPIFVLPNRILNATTSKGTHVCATTGIAVSLLTDGTTLHRFLGISAMNIKYIRCHRQGSNQQVNKGKNHLIINMHLPPHTAYLCFICVNSGTHYSFFKSVKSLTLKFNGFSALPCSINSLAVIKKLSDGF